MKEERAHIIATVGGGGDVGRSLMQTRQHVWEHFLHGPRDISRCHNRFLPFLPSMFLSERSASSQKSLNLKPDTSVWNHSNVHKEVNLDEMHFSERYLCTIKCLRNFRGEKNPFSKIIINIITWKNFWLKLYSQFLAMAFSHWNVWIFGAI